MTGLTQVPDKHLEGELTTERNFNRALLQAFPAGLFTVDSNRCVLSLNPEAERLLGWSKSSCVGADLHNLIGCTVESDELGRDRCSIDRVLETGKPTWARQAYIRCRNGVLKPVEFKCIPVTSHHSLGAIFCFRDLTSQLRLEQDLHRLASMPEQSPEPIVEFDAEANFIYANRVMMELLDTFGFSPGGFPRILPSNVTELVQACLSSGESLHGVEVSVGGSEYEWTFFPIPELALMRGYGVDLTERKKAEEELKRAHDAAVEAFRIRSEFLANVSHELRTPLNGIIGMTELTLDTKLTAEQQEYLGMVKESASTLLSLINDTLDFAKIEAGKLSLENTPFALRHRIVDLLKPLALRTHQKNVELICDIHPEVPNDVIGDPVRLQQILVNLIDNAIKFTEQGEIVLRVVRLTSIDGEGYLRFSVTDTGIGIPKEKQELIFKPFIQADGSATRLYGGTGLGLAIVGHLVDMMSGDLWVESSGTGAGSTFYFTAHLGVHDTEAAQDDRLPSQLRHRPVLIVDDNQTTREVLAAMLQHLGFRPITAGSAQEAYAILDKCHDPAARFDFIMVEADLMPSGGFELAKSLKARTDAAHIPLLMMTATSPRQGAIRQDDIEIEAFISKPVSASDMVTVIRHVFSSPVPAVEENPTPQMPVEIGRSGHHILIAEDNLVNQRLTLRLLEKRGHTVKVANNGQEALAALDEQLFDLILMDLQMPEMDGLEATTAIRAQESGGQHLPIIAMTAHTAQGDRERCLEVGMDDYISKPIEPQKLYAIIERFMKRSWEDGELKTMTSQEYVSFDEDALLARVDNDVELVHELVHLFLDDCQQRTASLELALENRDEEQLAQAAHTLKGSAGNLCAYGVHEAAGRLEAVARLGDLHQASSLFIELQREMTHLQTVLKEVVSQKHEPL